MKLIKNERDNSKKFLITTLGCKMNQYESCGMEELLINQGYRLAEEGEEANLYIINTCTVTKKTDQRSRQAIRRAKRHSPNCKIIVTGCYAQRFPEQLTKLENIDCVIGNNEKNSITNILSKIESGDCSEKIKVSDISKTKEFHDFFLKRFSNYTRAFMKIQDGCNHSCSYCAVRLARGQGRSLSPEKVLSQVKVLAASKYKEIVFTGINLGYYGKDLSPQTSLAEIIKRISDMEPNIRYRLSSIEPHEWDDTLIKEVTSNSTICPHFHIPLQSGSDRVLKLMRRGYSSSYYRNLIMKIHTNNNRTCIGADVIAGYPGEDETAFNDTVSLIEALPLSYLHAFSYSPRPGTRAFSEKETISPEEKKRRNNILRSISAKKRENYRKSFLDEILEVLVLSKRDNKTGMLMGLSSNYITVLFQGNDDLFNTIQKVKLISVKEDMTLGIIFNTL